MAIPTIVGTGTYSRAAGTTTPRSYGPFWMWWDDLTVSGT